VIISRRQLLWTGPTAAVLLLDGCGLPSGLVTTLDLVSAGIQATLPILSVVLPPPYGTVAALIGPFLNLITGAVNQTATELQSKDAALSQATKIEGYWAGVVLNPAVLAELPNSPISATNPQTPRGLVTGLVGAANAFLSAVASQLGGSVVTPPTSAVAHLSVGVQAHGLLAGNPNPFELGGGFMGFGGDRAKLKKIEKESKAALAVIKPHLVAAFQRFRFGKNAIQGQDEALLEWARSWRRRS
jgi:hypothetical protein